MKVFSKMAYRTSDEIIFGKSKYPLKYGFELEVGSGRVIPEIKYWPWRGNENDSNKVIKEYKKITKDIVERAINLGIEELQLETELSFKSTRDPRIAYEIINSQIDILEKFYSEYNKKFALRATVADLRGLRDLNFYEALNNIFEAFEIVSEAGAHVLSIESIGGKEVSDYALVRGDIEGLIYSLGILAVRDMRRLWKEITDIAKRNRVIPGGDTACGFANTAMKLAGGLTRGLLSHVFAAVVRALSSSRSLVAYEAGAVGPGKDCGYENVIIKAITGFPMSIEGKSSAVAHSSLMGNIVAATCDLWSNEQVENIKLFGGSGPQVFLEILHYDARLMNTAINYGNEYILRDLLIKSDVYRDPQALILSPKSAWLIGRKIVEFCTDTYYRTVQAGLTAIDIIRKNNEVGKLSLSNREKKVLDKIEEILMSLPDNEEDFLENIEKRYKLKIKTFNPKNYD